MRCPGNGVAAGAFRAQHRDQAGHDARETNGDMRDDDGQEHRRTGWDRDPEDDDAVVRHSVASDSTPANGFSASPRPL